VPDSSRRLVDRYRTLFDCMDEGFCIIEFLDGPHGPLSDYIHIEANAAYSTNAGIPNIVGQGLRLGAALVSPTQIPSVPLTSDAYFNRTYVTSRKLPRRSRLRVQVPAARTQ